jgi:hypothetical protein
LIPVSSLISLVRSTLVTQQHSRVEKEIKMISEHEIAGGDALSNNRFVVAAGVKEAVQLATSGGVRSLTVEQNGESFVLRGSCGAFYLRKNAIDAAKLRIAEALASDQVHSATLVDLIEVH